MDCTNKCGICWVEDKGKMKIIHKHDKTNGCEKWDHKYHEKCINGWIDNRIAANVFPVCPICSINIPIDKIPSKHREKAQQLLDNPNAFNQEIVEVIQIQQMPEHAINARYRMNMLRQYRNVLTPFMGIMICINRRHVFKCINSTLSLTIESTLGDIKREILQINKFIYRKGGIFSIENIKHNASISNWTNWKFPEYRVSDINYGIPPFTNSFPLLNSDYDLDRDEVFLGDIYEDYQSKAGYILDNINNITIDDTIQPITPDHIEHLKDLFCLKHMVWRGPTGPDDPGHYEDGFVCENNPDIPDDFRAYDYSPKSTNNSLAWIVVNLEIV